MDEQKLQKLNHLLSAIKRNSVSPKEIEGFLLMVLATIKKAEKDLSVVSDEKLKIIEDSINLVSVKHAEFQAKLSDDLADTENEISDAFLASITINKDEFNSQIVEARKIIRELKAIKLRDGIDGKDGLNGLNGVNGIDGKDGKNGSPDTPIEIKTKLETLVKDERLDISAVKGAEKFTTQVNLDRAIGILDQRTQFLINKPSTPSLIFQDEGTNITSENVTTFNVVGATGALTYSGSGVATLTITALSSVAWGTITGTLSNQTDLQTALNAKQNLATNLTSLSGLAYVSTSFVKMSAAGTFSLDTSTYLTGNQTITLSGDITGSGATAIATTLATVNSNVGSFTNATITVNGKGLITAASSGTAPSIALTLVTSIADETITAGNSAYVSYVYEIGSGFVLDILTGSVFEIG